MTDQSRKWTALKLEPGIRNIEPEQTGFEFPSIGDGIATCRKCGGPVLQGGRCPVCSPRKAKDDTESNIIRAGTTFNPNITT